MAPKPRIRSQLAIQVMPSLQNRLKRRAEAEGRTQSSLVIQWIEAGLASVPPDVALFVIENRVMAVEKRLAALETAVRAAE
jgi:predicted DNA-binding protein